MKSKNSEREAGAKMADLARKHEGAITVSTPD